MNATAAYVIQQEQIEAPRVFCCFCRTRLAISASPIGFDATSSIVGQMEGENYTYAAETQAPFFKMRHIDSIRSARPTADPRLERRSILIREERRPCLKTSQIRIDD